MSPRDRLRADFLNSMERMFSGRGDPLLLSALKAAFPSLSFALILDHIPEQAEDIYWVLIDLDRIAVVEIPRLSDELADVLMEILDIKAYQRGPLSALPRRKLKAAIELMRENCARDGSAS